MSRLGVDREIAELAIGHKRTGLDGLYNFDGACQRDGHGDDPRHHVVRMAYASSSRSVRPMTAAAR